MTTHLPRLPVTLDPLIGEAKRRMRRRRLLAGALAGVFALVLVSYLAFTRLSPRPAPAPAAAVGLGAILRDARTQHSVHYTSWASMGAAATEFVTGDVGHGRGVLLHRMHYWNSDDNKWHWSYLQVVVIGDHVYVRGTRSGLGLFAFAGRTHRELRRYAGTWISIPHGSRLHGLSAGGTLASFLKRITPRGRLTTQATTVHGQRVVTVMGTEFAGQTFLTTGSSNLLPVAASYVAGGGQGHTSISRWNEPVHVRAPAHSIPLSAVRRG